MNLRYLILRLLGYKTFDEMQIELREGKRKMISYKDGQKSVALERALLPKGIRYPKPGETYICIKDAPIDYMTHWLAPFTDGGKALFPKDEKILISETKDKKPTSAYCQAINVEKIEQLLIPQADREQLKYGGYSLIIETLTLNTHFKQFE